VYKKNVNVDSISQQTGSRSLFRKMVLQRQLIFMSLPFVIWCVVFCYIPIWGWIMAFVDFKPYNKIFENQWVGFSNFEKLFSDPMFYLSLRNTLAQSLIHIILGFSTAIGLAIMLNEVRNIFFKKTVQTISYLPHFISWVVGANIVIGMLSFDGPINALLLGLGIIDKPILFIAIKGTFLGLLGVTNVWKEVGWNAIIYLAALTMISPSLYEAADIDGANRYHKIRYITLPGIKPIFIMMLVLSVGNIMNSGFEQPYLLRNSYVMDVADNLDIFVLNRGMAEGQFSFATAAGIFKSVVSIVLLLSVNKVSKKMGESGIF